MQIMLMIFLQEPCALRMDLGKRIKYLRERAGKTQAELASVLDLEQSSFARLEGRGNRVTFEQLDKITQALGIKISDLLEETTPKAEEVQAKFLAEGEEFERLKARVRELEGMVADKQKIIKAYEEKLENIEDTLTMLIYQWYYLPEAERLGYWRVVEEQEVDENGVLRRFDRPAISEPENREIAKEIVKSPVVQDILNLNIVEKTELTATWYEAFNEIDAQRLDDFAANFGFENYKAFRAFTTEYNRIAREEGFRDWVDYVMFLKASNLIPPTPTDAAPPAP